ncbi:MAG: hypothetical protein WC373_07775 [Smithella sp.]
MTEKEQDISTELEKYKKQGCNLLMPSTHIAGLSEFHQPIIETVTLSTDPNMGDVYAHDDANASDEKGNINQGKKWRPTKQALMKLSVCAGVIWSPTESKRTDNGASREYISYRAVGGIKKADGQPVFFSAEYDLDFEVMADELRTLYEGKAKWLKKGKGRDERKATDDEKKEYVDYCVNRDLLQKRKNKLKLCEAGAMNRVLRMLLGLKQTYTTAELAKPFVMARIVFRPDFTDAAVKKQFVDASIKAMTGIYGPQALDQEIRTSKPIDITPLPDEEEPPAGETNHTNCETKQPDTIPFDQIPKDQQNVVLESLIKVTGYDINGYFVRCQVKALDDVVGKSRTGLYQHLLTLQKPEMEDIPY